jgi:hypothetical protein
MNTVMLDACSISPITSPDEAQKAGMRGQFMGNLKLEMQNIVLVAHDNKKQDLHSNLLVQYWLYAAGTTGLFLEKELRQEVIKLKSGPLGGDQHIGAKIAERVIDFGFFSGTPSNRNPMILI